MAETDEMNVADVEVWDYDDDDFDIPSESEFELHAEGFKEYVKREVDKIIRSHVSPSAEKLEQTIIKLRSINTLTTYPVTPQDVEEPTSH